MLGCFCLTDADLMPVAQIWSVNFTALQEIANRCCKLLLAEYIIVTEPLRARDLPQTSRSAHGRQSTQEALAALRQQIPLIYGACSPIEVTDTWLLEHKLAAVICVLRT